MKKNSFIRSHLFVLSFWLSLFPFLGCKDNQEQIIEKPAQLQRLSDGSFVVVGDHQVTLYAKDGSSTGKKVIVTQSSPFLFAKVNNFDQVVVQDSANTATVYPLTDSTKTFSFPLAGEEGPKQVLASRYDSKQKTVQTIYATQDFYFDSTTKKNSLMRAYFIEDYDLQGQKQGQTRKWFFTELDKSQRELQQAHFSDDGAYLVTVLQDGRSIGIYSLIYGRLLQVLKEGNQPIKQLYVTRGQSVGSNESGLQVISVGEQGETILWKSTNMGGDFQWVPSWKMTLPTAHQKEAIGFHVWSDEDQIFWMEWTPQANGTRIKIIDMLKDLPIGEIEVQGEVMDVGINGTDIKTSIGSEISITYEQILYVLQKETLGVYSLQKQIQDFWPANKIAAASTKNRFATISLDYRTPAIWEWDGTKNHLIQPYIGHDGNVTQTALSFDGTKMVTLTEKGTVVIWQRVGENYQQIQSIKRESYLVAPSCISLSLDGNTILIGYTNTTSIKKLVFNGSQYIAKTPFYLDTGDSAISLAMSSDGKIVAIGSTASKIYLFRLSTGFYTTLVGHAGGVDQLYLSDIGDTLLSRGGLDGIERVWKWDGTKYNNIRTFSNPGDNAKIAMSLNGQIIAIANTVNSQSLTVWKYDPALIDYQKIADLSGGSIRAISLSSDGHFLCLGYFSGAVTLFEDNGTTYVSKQTLSSHASYVASISFSGDNNTIVTGGYDHLVHVSKFDNISKSFISAQTLSGHANILNSVAISGDGNLVVTGSQDGTVHMWRQIGNKYEDNSTLAVTKGSVQQVLINQDGTKMVTLISVNTNGTPQKSAIVWVWDGSQYQSIQTLLGPNNNSLETIALSADGSTLGLSNDSGTQIFTWNSNSYMNFQFLKGSAYLVTLAISPNGNTIASLAEIWKKGPDGFYQETKQYLDNHSRLENVKMADQDNLIFTTETGIDTNQVSIKIWKNRGEQYEIIYTSQPSFDCCSLVVADIEPFSDGKAFILSTLGNGYENGEVYFSNPVAPLINLSL